MSWDQLLSIREQAAADAATPRYEACPNDGQPYDEGPDGALFCPYDGYRPAG